MKITPQHYKVMESAIRPLLESAPNAWAIYREFGHSATRFNWDVLRDAGLLPFVCDVLYKYANDSHITTALQKITGVR